MNLSRIGKFYHNELCQAFFFKSHFFCLTNLNRDQYAKFSYTCSDTDNKANYCGRNTNNSTDNKHPASELIKGDTLE